MYLQGRRFNFSITKNYPKRVLVALITWLLSLKKKTETSNTRSWRRGQASSKTSCSVQRLRRVSRGGSAPSWAPHLDWWREHSAASLYRLSKRRSSRQLLRGLLVAWWTRTCHSLGWIGSLCFLSFYMTRTRRVWSTCNMWSKISQSHSLGKCRPPSSLRRE